MARLTMLMYIEWTCSCTNSKTNIPGFKTAHFHQYIVIKRSRIPYFLTILITVTWLSTSSSIHRHLTNHHLSGSHSDSSTPIIPMITQISPLSTLVTQPHSKSYLSYWPALSNRSHHYSAMTHAYPIWLVSSRGYLCIDPSIITWSFPYFPIGYPFLCFIIFFVKLNRIVIVSLRVHICFYLYFYMYIRATLLPIVRQAIHYYAVLKSSF